MSTATPTKETIENEAGIKHPFFAEVAPGESLTVAAVLKEIDEKETPYGPVNRYKGDFVIRHHKNGKPAVPAVKAQPAKDGKPAVEAREAIPAVPASVRTVRSGTVYFPPNIGAEIVSNAAKIEGGWDSCEFKLSVSKDKDGKWGTPSFSVLPRVEGDRVLALLNS
jgi:hypothetical protein